MRTGSPRHDPGTAPEQGSGGVKQEHVGRASDDTGQAGSERVHAGQNFAMMRYIARMRGESLLGVKDQRVRIQGESTGYPSTRDRATAEHLPTTRRSKSGGNRREKETRGSGRSDRTPASRQHGEKGRSLQSACRQRPRRRRRRRCRNGTGRSGAGATSSSPGHERMCGPPWDRALRCSRSADSRARPARGTAERSSA